MRKWIILLRGVNVSGQKKIIMADLRKALAAAGYHEVETYIQSGNILLETTDSIDQRDIKSAVSELIMSSFGYQVEVFVLTPEWLAQIAKQNPFLSKPGIDPKQLYLTILDQTPGEEAVNRLRDFDTPGDEYIIDDQVIYIRYQNGAGKAKLTNNLIESKLKVKATSRNWNTTLKLIAMST